MEVVEEPPTASPIREQTAEEEKGKDKPSPKRVMPTEEELRAYPMKRPAIKGKITILEDRPVDIATERNERGERVASPLRKIVSAIAAANKKTFLEPDNGRFDDRNIER